MKSKDILDYKQKEFEKISIYDNGVFNDSVMDKLYADKVVLLKFCADKTSRIIKEQRPKSRSIFHFHFDEGAYKGETVISIRQADLSLLSIINMFKAIKYNHYVATAENALWKAFIVNREQD